MRYIGLICTLLLAVTAGAAPLDDAAAKFTKMKVERDGGTLLVRLHNPPQNLMDATMVAEIDRLADLARDDDTVRVIVFTGGLPGVFIQHYDVGELDSTAEAAAQDASIGAGDELHATHQAYLKLERLPKPVIAAINGVAMGGGFELALACDIRLLSEGGRVGLPEANVGILPGAGGTQRLPRLIGMARALELMMQGLTVDAETAAEYGMVNHVVPADRLLPEAMAIAKRIETLPPLAVGKIKEVVRQGIELPLEKGLRLEEDGFWVLMRSEEAQRRMRAYAQGGQASEEVEQ